VALLMEGMGEEISKAYIYVAMLFSVLVETLNLRMKATEKKLQGRDEPSGRS